MLLLFSSIAGQHQRCKRTLAVARDFPASAAVDGPRSRPPFAALAITLGLLPRATAKPTSASSRAPLPSHSLTHTLTLTDRIPQSLDLAAASHSTLVALPARALFPRWPPFLVPTLLPAPLHRPSSPAGCPPPPTPALLH
ncbi:hypothetical protein VPH35_137328 [Triticum aestivum]